MQGKEVTADALALYELERQRGVARDRVRDVACRRRTSAYIYGPPGTGKSHLVRETLDGIGHPYELAAGHVTPMGFFDLLKGNPDGTNVMEDTNRMLYDRIGQQLLLAALASGNNGDFVRVVTYQERNRREEVVGFCPAHS